MRSGACTSANRRGRSRAGRPPTTSWWSRSGPRRAAAEHDLLAWRSQAAAVRRVGEAGALMDAAKVMTTKMPIQLIQNSFISKNVEVGLVARTWNSTLQRSRDLQRKGRLARRSRHRRGHGAHTNHQSGAREIVARLNLVLSHSNSRSRT